MSTLCFRKFFHKIMPPVGKGQAGILAHPSNMADIAELECESLHIVAQIDKEIVCFHGWS